MIDYSTIYRSKLDNKFHAELPNVSDDVVIEALFPMSAWNTPEAYAFANIKGYEPMTAKELETEEQQDEKLNSEDYFLEEKFDGTRALCYFLAQECIESGEVVDAIGFCRVFSRRISKKTGFYAENTDSVPHIRDIDCPELDGTILDGEMFINGLPFKEVSSTLNCLWDKAVDRQIEKGFITFHAFDILFYRGIDLRKMPLERRKKYLKIVVEEVNSPYVQLVDYQSCGRNIDIRPYESSHGTPEDLYYSLKDKDKLNSYPVFSKEMEEFIDDLRVYVTHLTPRAFYEYIVATGGEGLIIKPKNGKYHHKRGWEYSKIKAFLTREMILIDFEEPTREYTGKAPKNWGYWEGDTPVTKHYYNKQVGNLVLGVLITEEELDKIPEKKRGKLYTPSYAKIHNHDELYIMEVCVTSGFDDETREYFTRNKDRLIGSVIEVKANDIMKDTGKLRHPRYLRMRKDKNPEQCTWKDHIGG